jgi:RNA polymerase sigma-70 factor (ECF subfamily)
MTEAGLVAEVPPSHRRALPGVSAERAEEFARLYESTFRELSGYCAAMLKDDHLATDLAQEAFVRLFARWRSVANPRGFLFVVATNLVRDEWRRRGSTRTLLSSMEPLVRESAPESDLAALGDVVLRLPQKEREVVVLHLMADLPLAEVARLTRSPLGTVKRRMHDARRRLRTEWTESP